MRRGRVLSCARGPRQGVRARACVCGGIPSKTRTRLPGIKFSTEEPAKGKGLLRSSPSLLTWSFPAGSGRDGAGRGASTTNLS